MEPAQQKSPIVAEHLNHWFGEGEASKQAIFDVSLEIEAGKFTILMGPSGSGKTTLLTLIGCLRDIQDGHTQLLGVELHGASEALLVSCRQKLGFIFQAHNLHESLTALQNVQMGLEVHSKHKASGTKASFDAASAHMLELVGLGDRIHYLPGNLSGGQKQRVAVARALVGNPKIIFADEPTAALDKESGLNVVSLLKRLGRERGTTTVMVTHDNRILEMADRIVTLEEGRIVDDKKF